VTITVNPANDAPVAVDDVYSVDEDNTLIVPASSVLDNDTDVDLDHLAPEIVGKVSHGTLVFSGNFTLTYTPTPDYNGIDTFTYMAYDGILYSNIATVTITVNPVNDAPIARDDAYYTPKNTKLTVDIPRVLTNDGDVDGDALSSILVNSTSHGTLNLNPNGSFTYTPVKSYTGTDSFTYRANDGTSDSNEAIVTIGINVDPYAINAPSNLAARASLRNVTLTWKDNSNNEGGFYIERATKTKGGSTPFVPVGEVGANVTTYIDAVPSSGTYIYRVQAFNPTTGRISSYSNQASVSVK
jgi:hypothetical protein